MVQGCWRKVTVDDLLPYIEQPAGSPTSDEAGASVEASGAADADTEKMNCVPLYPQTAHPVELWPAILMKAVLKIAALE